MRLEVCGRFQKIWVEKDDVTIVRQRRAFDGTVVTDKTRLPEPIQSLHLCGSKIIAICANDVYGESPMVFTEFIMED